MENLVYFVKNRDKFEVIGKNYFNNNKQNYVYVGGSPVLEKDYNILFKFFNRHSLYLEDVLDKHFEILDGRVEKIDFERGVENFPQEFFGFDNLKYLDLSGGNIISIPKKISKLQNLEKLYLDECGLRKIPYELIGLPNLEVVSLMENNIHDKNALNIVRNLEYRGVEVLI